MVTWTDLSVTFIRALPVTLVSVLKDRKSCLFNVFIFICQSSDDWFVSLRLVTTARSKEKNNYRQRFKNSRKNWQRRRDAWRGQQGTSPFYSMFNCSAALILFKYIFFLFDHCIIWSNAYEVTTNVLRVTGNYGFLMPNTNIFKHYSRKQIITICEVKKEVKLLFALFSDITMSM